MRHAIEHGAAELRRLKGAIDDAFARRTEDQEAFESWRAACAEFHARYDALAFPGGLARAFERLTAGDPVAAETAITFVELRPYFFRSQYHATKLIRLLKRLRLRADLQSRLDAALAKRREYRLRRQRGVW